MKKFRSLFEVYQLLEKTNCKKCIEKSCLAFSDNLLQNKKSLSDRPYIDSGILDLSEDNSISILQIDSTTIDQTVYQNRSEIENPDNEIIEKKLGGFGPGKNWC